MGFWSGFLKGFGKTFGLAAAPFTGGASSWLLPALTAGAGVAAGALGGKAGSRTQTSTAVEPEGYGEMRQLLNDYFANRLKSPTALPAGYETTGIGDINRAYSLIGQRSENDLTRRGLAGSPIAANVDATRENARASDVARFQAGLPLLERDLRNEDVAAAARFFGGRPLGTTTTAPGSALSGGFNSAKNMLLYLYGLGNFGNLKPAATQTFPTYPGIPPLPTGIPSLPGSGILEG